MTEDAMSGDRVESAPVDDFQRAVRELLESGARVGGVGTSELEALAGEADRASARLERSIEEEYEKAAAVDAGGEAATRLLAKAVVDLEIGLHLARLAERPAGPEADAAAGGSAPVPEVAFGARPESAIGAPTATATATRESDAAPVVAPDVEWELAILAGERGAREAASSRVLEGAFGGGDESAAPQPRTVDAGRHALEAKAREVAKQVVEGTVEPALGALGGVAGIGVGLLATGLTGLADVLKGAPALGAVQRYAQAFVARAHQQVVALLGREVVDQVAKHVADWLGALQKETAQGVLAAWYRRDVVVNELAQLVTENATTLPRCRAGLAALDALAARHRTQLGLVGRLLKVAGVVSVAAGLLGPAGKAVAAVVYGGLAVYVVGLGGDVMDTPGWWFQRVEGLRRTLDRVLRLEPRREG